MISGGPDPAISGWRSHIFDPAFNRDPPPGGEYDKVLFWWPTSGVNTAPALWVVGFGGRTPAFFDAIGERDDYDYKKPPRTRAAVAAYVVKFLSEFATADKVLSGEWFWSSNIARDIRADVIARLKKKGYSTTVPNAPHLPIEIR